MAFSVETQVKAKNTYAWLVCSLAEVGALFSTGSFVQAAVLDLATFDASATSAQPSTWDEGDEAAWNVSSSYSVLRNLASSFSSRWAGLVAKGDEVEALEFLCEVDASVSYERERVFG
jgi:hypothetical protein